MIADDHELAVTLDRVTRLQQQVAHLRPTVANPANYRASRPDSSPRSTACSARSASS